MLYQKEKCKKGELPKTEEISNRILTLPMYPGIPKEELDLIINSIKEFMQRGREDA